MIESRCGLLCSTCSYRESHGCGGCTNVVEPFHGHCKFKTCCESRGLAHCGQCTLFPCQMLIEFTYDDPVHGDHGRCLEQCRSWRARELAEKGE